MVTGILLGFGAAIAQSLSYVFSRLYVIRRDGAVLHLLVLGHVLMGAMSLLMLPFLPIRNLPPLMTYLWPLLGTAVFYVLGQAGMFIVLRRTEASRISPLLGLKIAILAVISILFLNKGISPLQWLAVGLSVAAAFLLNNSGTPLSRTAIAGVIVTCLFYSLSDLSIVVLVKSLDRLGPVHSILVGVSLCYILCGLAGAAVLPFAGRVHKGDWQFALPWAASWLAAMLLLFGCFANIGAVFGNVLQSTRGLISVLLGATLAGMGLEHVEARTSPGVLVRRVMAAFLMAVAIAVYAIG